MGKTLSYFTTPGIEELKLNDLVMCQIIDTVTDNMQRCRNFVFLSPSVDGLSTDISDGDESVGTANFAIPERIWAKQAWEPGVGDYITIFLPDER